MTQYYSIDAIWRELLVLIKENKIYRAKVSPISNDYSDQIICIYSPDIKNIAEIKQIYKNIETIFEKLNISKEFICGYKADYDTLRGIERYTTIDELKSYDENKRVLNDVLNIIGSHI